MKPGQGIPGAIAQHRTGMLLNDYRNSPYVNQLLVEHLGTTAIIAEPLTSREHFHGVVIISNNRTGKQFTPQDQEILRLFAVQAAIAIENARLYDALAIRLHRLQTLTRLNQLISSSLDLDHVLHEIAQAAATLMQAAVVSFWFVNDTDSSFETRTFAGVDIDANALPQQPPYDQDGIDWVMIHRQALNIPDVFADTRFVVLDWWRTHDLRSFLAVPVLYNDSLLAVLILHGRQPFHLQADTQDILDNFVTQAAIALDNARLFAEVTTQTAQLAQANVVLQQEILERQQAEAALREARNELESRVEARTAELRQANAQLQEEVRERQHAEAKLHTFAVQLQHSNRELQDFAYVASHDLQEPLRKIQSFGDRLYTKCSADLSEQGRDYIRRMQNAAHRMQTLINDLLTFSRVTTKAQPFTAVDLRRIVEEVTVDLEVRIEQTDGRIDCDDLMTIDADPLQMRQLFQNLLGNALKFHRPTVAPIVTIRGHIVSYAGQTPTMPTPSLEHNQVTVADNGIGFDEKYLDRLFNVFQRLHNRSAYEDTGLGLAVCRKIVERHGGTITARGAPEQGATFIITLPITQRRGATEHV